MKVSKCSGEKAASKELTWGEMIQSEGVYKCVGSDYDARVVVLISSSGRCCIFLYRCETIIALDPEGTGGWRSNRWQLANETVCFELKPA